VQQLAVGDDAPHEVVIGDPADDERVDVMGRHGLGHGLEGGVRRAAHDAGAHDVGHGGVLEGGHEIRAPEGLDGAGHDGLLRVLA
jgi:hypothetical protein